MFACLYVPDFGVQAALLAETQEIREALRQLPVVVLDGPANLLRVVALNDHARNPGIAVGMTKLQVEACGGVLLRKRSAATEDSAQIVLLECASAFSPRVESTAPGTAILDLTGTEKIFGSLDDTINKICNQGIERGFHLRVAIASNPDTALYAARGFAGRTVIPKGQEAVRLASLFHLYIELGCVSKLKARLDQEGIKSKQRTSAAGNRSGGTPYCRGALYQILKNRIYLGEIPHRGQNHPGEHAAIVTRVLWDRVQAQLKSDNQGRRSGLQASSPSLLVGLLQDSDGNRFTPCHTTKNGRRYRYYVCQAASDGGEAGNKPTRVPAHDVERQVVLRLRSFLQSDKDVMDALCLPEDLPARTQQIMATAAKKFGQLSSDAPSVAKDFVRKVVRHVVVHPDRIEVGVGKQNCVPHLMETNTPLQFAPRPNDRREVPVM
jgi:hypothetical protein